MLTTTEAAGRLGMSPRSVRMLIDRGDLVAVDGLVDENHLTVRACHRFWQALKGHAIQGHLRVQGLINQFNREVHP